MDAPERPAARRPRPALPWQAVVAATVLALTAAATVFVLLSDDDAAPLPAGRGTTGSQPDDVGDQSLELRPSEEVPSDPMTVELTDIDGSKASLADRLGERPTVVNFFASWCTPCVKEMPDFEAVHRQLGDRVDFLGVAVTDRPEDVTAIVERTGITYAYTRDIRGDLAGAAGVVQMPSTMFVSAEGDIVEVQAGAVDADELRALIEEHLGVVA